MRVSSSVVCVVSALCLLVAATSVVRAGNDGIALEAYTGERPDDAAKAVGPLLGELAQRGFSTGEDVARSYELKVSRTLGGPDELPIGYADVVDRGTKAWVGGKFEAAVALLSPLVDASHEATGAFLGNAKLRDVLLRALIVLGLSQQRLGDPGAAGETFAELIHSYPEATVARSTYGPEAAALFEQARKNLAAAPKGRLLVKVTDELTEVYINERLERRGTIVKELPPGTYRIVAQLGSKRSRNHRVTVKAGEELSLTIDPAFDGVVRTTGWAGFVFPSAGERERSEAGYAATFANAVEGHAVVVVSVDTVGGARAVVGSLVLMNGKEIRRASLALDPTPSADRVAALARFLAGEKATSGIDVQLDGAMPTVPVSGGARRDTGPDPRQPGEGGVRSGGGRWGGWPWITGGMAVLALGAGGVLLALDGTCPGGSPDPNCPNLYNTSTPAWISIGGGAVLAGLTVYLIVSRPSHAAPPARQAFVVPAEGGAIAGLSGRW